MSSAKEILVRLMIFALDCYQVCSRVASKFVTYITLMLAAVARAGYTQTVFDKRTGHDVTYYYDRVMSDTAGCNHLCDVLQTGNYGPVIVITDSRGYAEVDLSTSTNLSTGDAILCGDLSDVTMIPYTRGANVDACAGATGLVSVVDQVDDLKIE
jgi:hypothetical protein